MDSEKVDITEIQQLIKLVEDYGLKELTVSEGDVSITVCGVTESSISKNCCLDAERNPVDASPSPTPSRATMPRRTQPTSRNEPQRPRLTLLSPMTGVFYRSPSPDAPLFVDIGDTVRVGQIIGLIEAMKVFSEVPAEISGRVVEIVADNGKLVQADELLMYLEPIEE